MSTVQSSKRATMANGTKGHHRPSVNRRVSGPKTVLAAMGSGVAFLIAAMAGVAPATASVVPETTSGPAAVASARNKDVHLTGRMTILDHDWPDSDDIAEPTFEGYRTVGLFNSSTTYFTYGCSDEVQSLLWVTIENVPNSDLIRVKLDAALNELDGCPNGDNDGNAHGGWVYIATGETKQLYIHVNNETEGGDWEDIWVDVTNMG